MGVGAVCRPMVGVAVPCDPHGVNHIEDVDNVDEGSLTVFGRVEL